ncbi:LysR family transcriptional regulator [Serratia marcescens]|uniref:LysR family transcriptional regulator n=1 Tax=Serratia TaxID=613 RepID=UPI00065161D2|nr:MULTISPECIES: LysR substrate-binding domain-containing protein [Serratia]AVU36225.1 LysR family transcriptional regulator [Serratia marcescens]AVU41355.1 LysR family transcriptional regulator [Serratia marcescens]EGT0503449.1 LysR family transcriptional regulator [Serratia marcescens]EHT9828448.1 LysR family transcriptional regulator [Serratia marcescens]EIU0885830.1 LysR family transcriptional regulator [Serratia marcescens]
MKLHQLQALVASADSGSIRAAARHLGLSQAAVTRALRELEQEQALPLLIRTPTGLGFTPYGKTLLAHARLVLNQLQQAQGEMAALRGRTADLVKAAITPWLMLTVLPPAVMAFRSKVPAVRLELSESLMANAQSQLREGTMDFAITPLPASSAPQEFHCEPLLEYETAYMVRRGHPLAHSTSLHQLLEQDWVMSYTPESFDALLDAVFHRHGARLPRQRIIQAHSFGMLQALVESAEMCTWCPLPIAALPQFASRLQPLALRESGQPTQLNIVTRRNSILSAAAHAFIDTLVRTLRQQARSSRPEDRQIYDRVRLLI